MPLSPVLLILSLLLLRFGDILILGIFQPDIRDYLNRVSTIHRPIIGYKVVRLSLRKNSTEP